MAFITKNLTISLGLAFIICVCAAGQVKDEKFILDKTWLKGSQDMARMVEEFGQLAAVTVDKDGMIYLFHRSYRKWDANTFLNNNRLRDESSGPITRDTIIVLEPNGKAAAVVGRNIFYLPHGLTVDDDHNIWTTDVGLHQVIKFPPLLGPLTVSTKLSDPIFTLGTALRPGKDKTTFCKPTSVAVDSESKDFFVADGYCNSRIVKYDEKGRYLMEWGKPTFNGFPFARQNLGPFNMQVPHSLAIDTSRQQLIVADRENSRILFYSLNGKIINVLRTTGRVYGVAYSAETDSIYAVTGPAGHSPGIGMEFSAATKNITSRFGEFKNAHDIAVSPDGSSIYAVETDPHVMWRFTVAEEGKISPEATKIRRVNPVGLEPKQPEEVDVSPGDVSPKIAGREGGDAFDAVAGLGANQIALSILTLAVILAVVSIMCHLRKKKGSPLPMERRGLILDDYE